MWSPNILWKLFDMCIGGIQAFIFALLTVLYFAHGGRGTTTITTTSTTPRADDQRRDPRTCALTGPTHDEQ